MKRVLLIPEPQECDGEMIRSTELKDSDCIIAIPKEGSRRRGIVTKINGMYGIKYDANVGNFSSISYCTGYHKTLNKCLLSGQEYYDFVVI